MREARVSKRKRAAAGAAAALGAALFIPAACERTQTAAPGAVFVLLDISQSFFPQKAASLETAQEIVKGLPPRDRFALVKVGECSFGKENVLADADLPAREDLVAQTKIALIANLGKIGKRLEPAHFTDIAGALWEVRREREGAAQGPVVIVIFSDLVADVHGSRCHEGRDSLPDLTGARVILADIGEANGDRADPRAFFARVEAWTGKLKAAGAADATYVSGRPRVRAAVETALAAGK
jgi:hypothetical protein